MVNLTTLAEVENEIKRFNKRLKEAKERLREEGKRCSYICGNKQTGALKRAAMDLKNELTKITQG